MKRVAVISHSAAGGGAERVATVIANGLCRLEQTEVFFCAIHSDKREYFLDDRVSYTFISEEGDSRMARMLSRMKGLRRLLKDNRIDVMISFVYDEGYAAMFMPKLKKIYSLRNDPSRIKRRRMWIIERLYVHADQVVFQTNDAKAFFGRRIRKHGTVIPNPIEPALPYWQEQDHDREIIAAGRLNSQKNFPMLLRAFAIFHKDYPEYRLTICGDGDDRSKLTQLAGKLGISDSVTFTGHVTDIHERMTRAAMYVSSSDYEGISNSMLEALAIGIPTICTDCPVGGARMFIDSGVNGFLVPVGDHEALAQAMAELAGNTELCRSFSAASQKIREELDAANICEKWRQLI